MASAIRRKTRSSCSEEMYRRQCVEFLSESNLQIASTVILILIEAAAQPAARNCWRTAINSKSRISIHDVACPGISLSSIADTRYALSNRAARMICNR